MGDSLNRNGRLGRAGVLRAPGAGRAAAAISVGGLVLLGLVAAALVPQLQDQAAAADDLTRQALVGPRNLTCQRVVVLLDQSGSMSEFAQVRTDAMKTLADWAPENLRGNDQLAVVSWADTAAVDAAPTDVSSLTPSSFSGDGSDVGGGTDVLPAVDQVAQMTAGDCRTSLVFISDGQIAEVDQSLVDAALQDAGVDRVSLVLPNSTAAPEYWMQLFSYSQTFYADPHNPNQTARALGQAIASATGQELAVQR